MKLVPNNVLYFFKYCQKTLIVDNNFKIVHINWLIFSKWIICVFLPTFFFEIK